ncbi:MAG: tetratricopeptide repeat protein [Bacteroidetes bacterium]|nr:tetratricopeptide repeat protein [Bacteroidota bacterium]
MTITTKTLMAIMFITFCQLTFAQTNEEKAYEKGMKAIELMDNGKIEASIELLEEAQKLDPDRFDYPYELAYAHYLKKDYKGAIKILEKVEKHKDVTAQLFQLLGNSYDMIGKPEDAIEMYEKGVKKFPNAGNLYLELGIMQMGKEEYNKALDYYEKGIEVDPQFPSNYYWAARIYCNSSEEVWGMIYGEIFMNLERNSKRTVEISKLLYDTYNSQIQFTNDTTFSISFSQNATINISDLSDPTKFKMPYCIGVYEPTLMLSLLAVRATDINSLDTIRSIFVDSYFTNKHDESYPNVLFSYQKQIKEAGHMESYNHWILMQGDLKGFDKWYDTHKTAYDDFTKWFSENGLIIDEENKFSSSQY